jgi:hypothetical protein
MGEVDPTRGYDTIGGLRAALMEPSSPDAFRWWAATPGGKYRWQRPPLYLTARRLVVAWSVEAVRQLQFDHAKHLGVAGPPPDSVVGLVNPLIPPEVAAFGEDPSVVRDLLWEVDPATSLAVYNPVTGMMTEITGRAEGAAPVFIIPSDIAISIQVAWFEHWLYRGYNPPPC